MLLMNLILTELGVCLYGIPVDLVATMQGGWGMGEGLCTATGFILTLLGRYSYSFIYLPLSICVG